VCADEVERMPDPLGDLESVLGDSHALGKLAHVSKRPDQPGARNHREKDGCAKVLIAEIALDRCHAPLQPRYRPAIIADEVIGSPDVSSCVRLAGAIAELFRKGKATFADFDGPPVITYSVEGLRHTREDLA
jgi:hypothetical protein